MKYIMIEYDDGMKTPFIFPEHIIHADMAQALAKSLVAGSAAGGRVVSAGFVGLGQDITVHGKSESLGGLKSIPLDAFRIMAGDAVAHMSDVMLVPLLGKLAARKSNDDLS